MPCRSHLIWHLKWPILLDAGPVHETALLHCPEAVMTAMVMAPKLSHSVAMDE